MAPANVAELQRRASGCALVHSAEMTPMQQAELESKQAMTSLCIASQYIEHHETIIDSTEVDWNNGDEYLILSQRSTELFREGRARAAIARLVPLVSQDDSEKL